MPSESGPISAAAWKPKHNPWAIALTVTLATFMEVLDTSIANVALPHIAGGLGASQDEATWVLTSYLVSNAVILPMSAYLTSFVGRKRFYMWCVVLFGISSALCGLAPSLPLLIFFRVLQGAGGGGLAPSEQAILADTFPPKKRGQAFAVYGLAVVAAPAIGPTLGGWITDNYDWRWIFFINVPVAIISLFLTSRMVEDPPHIVEEVKRLRSKGLNLDYTGFALLAIGFGSLEFVLDKGQEDDWFGSHIITTFTIMCVTALLTLLLWEIWQIRKGHKPILDLTRGFRRRVERQLKHGRRRGSDGRVQFRRYRPGAKAHEERQRIMQQRVLALELLDEHLLLVLQVAREAAGKVKPGGTLLLSAHRELEALCLDRELAHFKQHIGLKYAEVVYFGLWFTPLRESLQAFVSSSQGDVNGAVTLALYKGNVEVAGRQSETSLYRPDIASFTMGASYDQKDAAGFIRILGLPARTRAIIKAQEPQDASLPKEALQ